MNNWMERIAEFWCASMHGTPMWPARGRYECRVCHRTYPVRFEAAEESGQAQETLFHAPALARRV